MDYFPQLSTGNMTQYPISKRQLFRTVSVVSEDGRNSKSADGGGRAIQWELQFAELTAEEWTRLSNHFTSAEGRLNSFPFLDGSDNLLKWSEKLSDSAWTLDPLLHALEGAADPNGSTHGLAIQNSGTTWQGFSQMLAAPAAFTYSFSVNARSEAGARLRMSVSGNGQQVLREFVVGQEWQRYVATGSLPGTGLSVRFGVEIDQASHAELYGLQVEPQSGASRYKKTTALNGVYANTRYDQDELKLTSNRPDEFSTTIRLISREPL